MVQYTILVMQRLAGPVFFLEGSILSREMEYTTYPSAPKMVRVWDHMVRTAIKRRRELASHLRFTSLACGKMVLHWRIHAAFVHDLFAMDH